MVEDIVAWGEDPTGEPTVVVRTVDLLEVHMEGRQEAMEEVMAEVTADHLLDLTVVLTDRTMVTIPMPVDQTPTGSFLLGMDSDTAQTMATPRPPFWEDQVMVVLAT